MNCKEQIVCKNYETESYTVNSEVKLLYDSGISDLKLFELNCLIH
jgi:hypothetical protein